MFWVVIILLFIAAEISVMNDKICWWAREVTINLRQDLCEKFCQKSLVHQKYRLTRESIQISINCTLKSRVQKPF